MNKSTIKYIQSLQEKKFRDAHGCFIAEGPKLVAELLSSKVFECENIYATEDGPALLDPPLRTAFGDKTEIVLDFELQKISGFATPNHLLAVFKKRLATKPVFENSLSLALADLQDPGNLGTIIRTADWFGVETILCSAATADCYNPKVVQSTMGSLARVNIVYGDLRKMLAETSVAKYAAVLGGKDLRSFGSVEEGVIIIGNESKGLDPDIAAMANERVAIPKTGEAESLNAAVAAALLLYAFRGA